MSKSQIYTLVLLVLLSVAGLFVYYSESDTEAFYYRPFKLGLDLSGGSHLVYEADTSTLGGADIGEAMNSLREVIERRVNIFGVSEPIIQVEQSGNGAAAKHRLIVELPGVTDPYAAAAIISKTPTLEFKVERPEGPERDALIASSSPDAFYVATALTGKYLERASVQFSQQSIAPTVSLDFNPEGEKLFAQITSENIGKTVAIYLDGAIISAPVVREAITSGQAEISGQFSVEEAKQLVRDLNLGALPVPVSLLSTESIGPTLGREALDRGIQAGLIGFLAVALFMIWWYRVPGLVAMISLVFYVILILALFKLMGVVLTAAAIAGLILSFGMALDANILISERLKEELRAGKHLHEAIKEGFSRAWFSIRDANLSSLISAVVLFWLGTSLMRGFAFTLIIGIVVSMFTAIAVTRVFMLSVAPTHSGRWTKSLFKCGFK